MPQITKIFSLSLSFFRFVVMRSLAHLSNMLCGVGRRALCIRYLPFSCVSQHESSQAHGTPSMDEHKFDKRTKAKRTKKRNISKFVYSIHLRWCRRKYQHVECALDGVSLPSSSTSFRCVFFTSFLFSAEHSFRFCLWIQSLCRSPPKCSRTTMCARYPCACLPACVRVRDGVYFFLLYIVLRFTHSLFFSVSFLCRLLV